MDSYNNIYSMDNDYTCHQPIIDTYDFMTDDIIMPPSPQTMCAPTEDESSSEHKEPDESITDNIMADIFDIMNKYEHLTKANLRIKMKIRCGNKRSRMMLLLDNRRPLKASTRIKEIRATHSRRSQAASMVNENTGSDDETVHASGSVDDDVRANLYD